MDFSTSTSINWSKLWYYLGVTHSVNVGISVNCQFTVFINTNGNKMSNATWLNVKFLKTVRV